ncbi:hypothetical protein Tco_1133827 [Tanacetum coccineum]
MEGIQILLLPIVDNYSRLKGDLIKTKDELGNGEKTWFWKDKWVGDFKLCDRFQRLLRFEGDEDVSVRNHGEWSSDGWRWEWEWVGVTRGCQRESYKSFKEIITYRVHDTGAHDEETSWCKIMPRKIFSCWDLDFFNGSSICDILSVDSSMPSKLKIVVHP